jgi:hypothetical protein
MKPTVLEREPSPGVVDQGQGQVLLLELGKTPTALHRQPVLDVLDGLGPGGPKISDGLLLGDRRPLSQPRVLCPPSGQLFIEDRRTTRFTGPP